MAKAKYIQTSTYTLVGNTGSPSADLAPGERVLLTDSESHKFLAAQIEAGNPEYEHLSIVEVDHEAEKAQAKERAEQQQKADEIAAQVRQEMLQEQRDEGVGQPAEALEDQPAANEGTEYPPQDVEAQKLAEESGPGQRASTQEDVVPEEGGTAKMPRRRSGRSG